MPGIPLARKAFTLVEILVSILIFSVVSLAMVTILLTSTRVFRAGEYGRSSNDEALAALGTLDEDLKRMVPVRDGGFFYAREYAADAATFAPLTLNGSCAVAFTVTGQAAGISSSGVGARQVVIYWVDTQNRGLPTEEEVLCRAVAPVAADLVPAGHDIDTVKAELFPTGAARPYASAVVARRCLHFGVWISSEEKPRATPDNWELDTANAAIAPDATGADYCTEAVGGVAPDPVPTAVRFTLTMAAGRYAPTGYLIEDDQAGKRIRVAGLPSVPTAPGSMARIDDEWIAYKGYQGGALLWDTGMRPARRSTATPHLRNAKVELGQSYSLARILPH